MTMRDILLRAYPRKWREEYGEELAAILAQSCMTISLVADTLVAALRYRLDRAMPWPLCAALLLLRVLVMRFVTFDRATLIGCYFGTTFLVLVTTGAWMVRRRGAGVWKVTASAAKVGLVGEIPVVVLYCLTIFGAPLADHRLIFRWMVKTVVLNALWATLCGLAGAAAARGHQVLLRRLRNA